MTEAGPKPVAWVRADNRAIIWWGAAYPSHWEPGEGFALYDAPSPPAEPGWVLVPIEPDETMLVNGREALMPLLTLKTYGPLIGIWKDMLEHRPSPASRAIAHQEDAAS